MFACAWYSVVSDVHYFQDVVKETGLVLGPLLEYLLMSLLSNALFT